MIDREKLAKEFFEDYINMEMILLCDKWWKRWEEIPEPDDIVNFLEKAKNYVWGKTRSEMADYAYRAIGSVCSAKRT